MKWGPQDDTLLRRYLLGKLRKRKTDRLERRLLEDDELFKLAEAVEADLLAAADRGDLAPAERERVLHRLASSPQGRERLALARSLNTVADEKAVVVPDRRTSVFSLPAIRWVALAASLLMVAGLVWFALQRGPQAPEATSQMPMPTPTRQVQEVKPEPSPPDLRANETPKPPQPPQRRATPPVDVLTLTLMSLRGADEQVAKLQKLHLSPGSHTAEFRITMLNVDAKSCNVAINRAEKTVWEKSALKTVERGEGGTLLLVDVPSEIFSTGRYQIAVTAIAAEGESDSEMSEEFEVVQTNR